MHALINDFNRVKRLLRRLQTTTPNHNEVEQHTLSQQSTVSCHSCYFSESKQWNLISKLNNRYPDNPSVTVVIVLTFLCEGDNNEVT